MKCPDLRTLSRVGTRDADPAVVEHVSSCESCWLDWQIQQGARHLNDPVARESSDLNDRVLARVRLRSRRYAILPARWSDAALCGMLVAVAVLAGALAAPTMPMPLAAAAGYAVVAGVASMVYVKRRDERLAARSGALPEE